MGRLPWQTLGPHSVEPGRQRRSDPDRLKTRERARDGAGRTTNSALLTRSSALFATKTRCSCTPSPSIISGVTGRSSALSGSCWGLSPWWWVRSLRRRKLGSSGMNVGDRAVWPLVSPCRATVLGWTGRAAICTRSSRPARNPARAAMTKARSRTPCTTIRVNAPTGRTSRSGPTAPSRWPRT